MYINTEGRGYECKEREGYSILIYNIFIYYILLYIIYYILFFYFAYLPLKNAPKKHFLRVFAHIYGGRVCPFVCLSVCFR